MHDVHSVDYQTQIGSFVSHRSEFLEECAALYSEHYGKWAADSPKNPGEGIRLSPARLREWLVLPESRINLARVKGRIIGYAIAVRAKMPRHGIVTWVTQLVVHSEFRQRGVAKNLLFSLWSFSDHFAWGIVSANPYAIRALEKATRRRVEPVRIKRHRNLLLNFADKYVTYITNDSECEVTRNGSRINTKFFVDHTGLSERINAASRVVPWGLENLRPGWEWLAFTFQDQPQMDLTQEEITLMLSASDDVVRDAYSRMTLDKDHRWTRHTGSEVDFIIEHCGIRPGATVLDVGCGNGRHAIELAGRGFDVTGVDYSPVLISSAKAGADRLGHNCDFKEDDFRTADLGTTFDVVTCLYDVIGSFAEAADNFKIVRNLFRHVRPGGVVLLSVMNRTLTESNAKHWFSLKDEPSRLLELQPSRTMETSGDVFDPDYYMIEKASGVVYRKEQFEDGDTLPEELIVRDRRYEQKEISNLCFAVGFEVIWARCVRSGDWKTNLPADHSRAKEILVLCRKPV